MKQAIRSVNGADGAGAAMTPVWAACVALLSSFLVILMVTPFAPAMPFESLDGSWMYAMNHAVAEQLRFGTQIVFTFGPLASVYTTLYHPATDLLMLGGSLLIAAALFAGMFAVAPPRWRAWLLLLPLVLGLGVSRDVAFLFLPVLLPCVVMRGIERGRAYSAVVCLIAAAMAILPLVKGNFGVMVALASAATILLGWRLDRRTVMLALAVQLIVMPMAWMASGQALPDLPRYFIAQAPIISGYTDGMSVVGRGKDILYFLLAAVVLVGLSLCSGGRRYWHVTLLVAAYLFVTFKSGFVRHDLHALTAAVALTMVGAFLCIHNAGRAGMLALVIGLAGWWAITDPYAPVTPKSLSAQFAQSIQRPAAGLVTRMIEPEALGNQFKAISAAIGSRAPFAGYTGTADVYPTELAPLIAAGSTWVPRPILQSYSVYTPALATANADHLLKDPPSRIYFKVDPIDHRYPAMDDGASWLPLLGSYTPVALEGGYAVLQRSGRPPMALQPQDAQLTVARVDQEVAVPDWREPVWVSMDIRPTPAGRIASTLYKLPKLSIKVRFENGLTADYRLIAGSTRTGFLLSPTVADARDFVALSSGSREELLRGHRVVAFTVYGDSGTRRFWNSSFPVTFARLPIPEAAGTDRVLAAAQELAH
ncbi:hypothetical protein ACVALR_06200 [Stenotrophomonas maltophilia]